MALSAPTNLHCSISGTNLTATWDSVSGAVAYRVHVYKNVADQAMCDSLSSGFTSYIVTTNSFTKTISTTDTPLCLHVRACSTTTCSSYGPGTNTMCSGDSGCSGTPQSVTNLSCLRTGDTLFVSWNPPVSGTYDRFRVHYYIGTSFVERFVTTTSDSYVSSTVDSVHVRAFCGTYQSSPTISSCPPICTPNWRCRQPLDGYEHDVNNCGDIDRLNPVCNPIIKYKCQNGECISDNGDGSGIYTDSSCNNECCIQNNMTCSFVVE